MGAKSTKLPPSPLARLRTVELTPKHEQALQRFFEANPQYFIAVNGEPPGPDAAHEEIHGELPPGFSHTRKWLVGFMDETNAMAAMANVVSDLLAAGVWHIGLFIVAAARHGTGDAEQLYRGLEAWARSNGAAWMRLGVVQGNARAERFWERLGFHETRTRTVDMGNRTNIVRVMMKPLAGGTLEQYLSLVERDRPEGN
jgi:GNAT superfamily N-acetyltransferase